MLSPYGNVVSLASCRAYYDDKVLGVLDGKKKKLSFGELDVVGLTFISSCKVVCSFGSNIINRAVASYASGKFMRLCLM